MSDYVRELLQEDEKRKARAKLEAFLLDGLRSGEAAPMTSQDWEEIRREAVSRMRSRGLIKPREIY